MKPTVAVPPALAARYRREGHWSDIPIGRRFADTCARHARKLALVDGGERLTFAELDRLARRMALGLLALGVGPGDVVAYQLPNWWEAAVTFLAAARVGAVVNPVLPMFRAHELRFVLGQSQARVLLVPGTYRDCHHPDLIAGLRGDLPALTDVLVVRDTAPAGMRSFATFLDTPWERAPQTADRMVTAVDPDSLMLLMYTSGTTADPKGVLHSHNTLSAEVQSLARVHGLTPADVTLMPSPLTHISGVIHAILTPALLGTAAVLMERWDAAAALELIDRERISYMVGAPTFLRDLSEHAARGGRAPTTLRLFSCGGAEVSPDLIRRARAALGCLAKRVYGSTEFPTITTTDAADAESMGIETEGRPIWPGEVRIAAEDGEVQARGPECFLGYTDPVLTAAAFTDDGWFRTGDVGSIDDGGYLRITGRIKDIVIRKGEKFSLRELEELIARHPAVAEVAVLAVPDAQSGERACAAVVLRPGAALDLATLTAFLTTAGLAKQKLPEQLVLVAELPRTDSGKIHRAELKARIAKSTAD